MYIFNGKTFGNGHEHRDHRTIIQMKRNLSVNYLSTTLQLLLHYLLGFTTTGIGNEESTVILNEDFLDFLLGSLIDELLVESDNSLGKSLTDGINLRSVT